MDLGRGSRNSGSGKDDSHDTDVFVPRRVPGTEKCLVLCTPLQLYRQPVHTFTYSDPGCIRIWMHTYVHTGSIGADAISIQERTWVALTRLQLLLRTTETILWSYRLGTLTP